MSTKNIPTKRIEAGDRLTPVRPKSAIDFLIYAAEKNRKDFWEGMGWSRQYFYKRIALGGGIKTDNIPQIAKVLGKSTEWCYAMLAEWAIKFAPSREKSHQKRRDPN